MIAVEVDVSGLDAWIKPVLAKAATGLEALIYNLVPYVIYLEYGRPPTEWGGGWSEQAPYGMMRISLAEIAAHAKRKVADVPFDHAAKRGDLRQRLAEAIDDAAEYGRLLIRSRTPIDTGRARRGWQVKPSEEKGKSRMWASAAAQLKEHPAQARVREIVKNMPIRERGGYWTRSGERKT